jgi:hypothetical protein
MLLLGALLAGQVDQDAGRPAPNGPAIVVQPRTLDLGMVIRGEAATGTLTVANRGNADLVIDQVITCCPCTVVELAEEQRTIPPGQTRDLTVRFDSTNRLGREHHVILLLTNDPVRPEMRVMIASRVEEKFRVLPDPLISLLSARRGANLPPLEVFPTVEGTVLQDLQVEVPPGLIEIEREEIINDAGVRGFRLLPRVPDEAEPGDVQGGFVLHGVVDGEAVDVHVEVTGQVMSELRAVPAALQSLTPTLRGHQFPPVLIESVLGRPFQVLSAEAGPHLDVQVTSQRSGSEWKVQATLRDSAPDGPFATLLRVRTDNTAQPLFEIPVYVLVRPRVIVEPAIVLLGPLPENRGRTVRIQFGGAEAPRVRELHADPAKLRVVREQSPPHLGGTLQYRISLVEGEPPMEDFVTEVVLKFDFPGVSEVAIPVEYYSPR